MKRRSDDDRRRELKLSNLRHEASKLAHQRDMLRLDLADLWSRYHRDHPEAREVEGRLWPVIRAWEAKTEEIRAVLTEGKQHAQ